MNLKQCWLLVAPLFLAGQAYAQAVQPCAVVMCMRGAVDGQYKAGGCPTPVARYFAIQVWDPKYNASATEQERRRYINQCTDSSAADREAIQNRYGRVQSDPSV